MKLNSIYKLFQRAVYDLSRFKVELIIPVNELNLST